MKKKSFTLKGAAAGAFVEAQAGLKAKTFPDAALRIATLVHVHMSTGDTATAVAIVRIVATRGLLYGAEICTADAHPLRKGKAR